MQFRSSRSHLRQVFCELEALNLIGEACDLRRKMERRNDEVLGSILDLAARVYHVGAEGNIVENDLPQ